MNPWSLGSATSAKLTGQPIEPDAAAVKDGNAIVSGKWLKRDK
jgi:hypothetical protein